MSSERTSSNFPLNSDLEEVNFDENDVIEVIEDGENVIASDIDDDENTLDTEEANSLVIESDGEADGSDRLYEDNAQTVFTEHQQEVLCCQFHPKTNDIAVTGGIDDKAFIWNPTNGNKLFTCKGHENSVEIAIFSYDGTYLATGDLNGVINVWRVRDYELISTFALDDEPSVNIPLWMQWHHGINVLVACSQNGMIYMYKIPSSESKVFSLGQACLAGKIQPDGRSLACGFKDGSLKIIDLRQGTVIEDIKPIGEIQAITCLDVSKSNNLIICGCECGSVILANANTGKIVSVLQGCQNSDGSNYIETVSFCKDSSFLVAASGSLDGTLSIWDVVRQTLRHKYKFQSCITQLVWHLSQPLLFTCHVEGIACAFDAKAGVVLKEYLGHRKSCLSMALSSDGSYLMTTSEDKTARIFYVGNLM